MKYSCLIVDHDDTVVDSSRTVHFPCFLEYMEKFHPEVRMDFDTYVLKNFTGGILPLFHEIGMSEEEIQQENRYWSAYVENKTAPAYPGMKEVLDRFVRMGGKLFVVSHSYEKNILRDYIENGLPEPLMVFGWDDPPEKRKPSVYPVRTIMEKYGFRPEEMLMLDDLKPGYDMAKATGISFAAAGWAYRIPEIRSFMEKNCDVYVDTVSAFSDFLFS